MSHTGADPGILKGKEARGGSQQNFLQKSGGGGGGGGGGGVQPGNCIGKINELRGLDPPPPGSAPTT